jgi:hypothetical protein
MSGEQRRYAIGASVATLAMGGLMGGAFASGSAAFAVAATFVATGLMFVAAQLIQRAGGGVLLALAAIWAAVGMAGLVAGFWPLAVWLVPALGLVAYAWWSATRRARWHRVGRTARGTVLEATRTGTVINNFVLVWKVRFEVRPDDGSPSFEGTKRMRVPLPDSVEVGQRFPLLWDPGEPGTFVIDERERAKESPR